jgi:hypothetical protein
MSESELVEDREEVNGALIVSIPQASDNLQAHVGRMRTHTAISMWITPGGGQRGGGPRSTTVQWWPP